MYSKGGCSGHTKQGSDLNLGFQGKPIGVRDVQSEKGSLEDPQPLPLPSPADHQLLQVRDIYFFFCLLWLAQLVPTL